MTCKERFYATIERKPVDRPASWLGLPVKESMPGLLRYFNADSLDALHDKLDDDIYPVDMPWRVPGNNEIFPALNFTKKGVPAERTLTAPGFFEDYEDPAGVLDFDWPDPKEYIDPNECRRAVLAADPDKAVVGILWSAHFQDACAAFGLEAAMVKMLLTPEMFRAVIDRITEFYLSANEVFYEAAHEHLDAVLLGNDLGTQNGLLESPDLIRIYAIPGVRKLVAQAKTYGLKVIYHSCGSIYNIIPDLIDAGVDVIHPIQALAAGMEPERLKDSFGERVSFCGGVDTQYLLPFGKPEHIRDKVMELKRLFPTGLIISPSHEAILPDVDPENIQALFDAVKM